MYFLSPIMSYLLNLLVHFKYILDFSIIQSYNCMEYNKEGGQLIDQYGNEITWVPKLSEKKGSLYISIANCIEEDIKKGILKGGFRLPPQRVIANHLGINHSTVTRAYKLCEEKGLIRGVTGKGTFVTSYAGIPQNLLTSSNDLNIIEMGTILPLYELNDLIESFIKEIYQNIDFKNITSNATNY